MKLKPVRLFAATLVCFTAIVALYMWVMNVTTTPLPSGYAQRLPLTDDGYLQLVSSNAVTAQFNIRFLDGSEVTSKHFEVKGCSVAEFNRLHIQYVSQICDDMRTNSQVMSVTANFFDKLGNQVEVSANIRGYHMEPANTLFIPAPGLKSASVVFGTRFPQESLLQVLFPGSPQSRIVINRKLLDNFGNKGTLYLKTDDGLIAYDLRDGNVLGFKM